MRIMVAMGVVTGSAIYSRDNQMYQDDACIYSSVQVCLLVRDLMSIFLCVFMTNYLMHNLILDPPSLTFKMADQIQLMPNN